MNTLRELLDRERKTRDKLGRPAARQPGAAGAQCWAAHAAGFTAWLA